MSQRNVELLQRCSELLNVGDLDAVGRLYHPDATVEFRGLKPPGAARDVQRVHDAVRHVVAHWTAPYAQFGTEVREYLDADPWVVCDTRSHRASPDPGAAPVEIRFADAYEIRDGQIVRAILGNADVAEALTAIASA